MPYCNPKGNEALDLNLKTVKPAAGMIEKDGPLVESPVAMNPDEGSPEGSTQSVRAVSR